MDETSTRSLMCPSLPRISTITVLSFLDIKAPIVLYDLFQHIRPVKEDEEGILKLKIHRYEDHKHVMYEKTFIAEERNDIKHCFRNQLTIIWLFKSHTGSLCKANCMLFNNGKLKIVGIQHESNIIPSLNALVHYLQPYMHEVTPLLTFSQTRCCMINTDFSIGFRILREEMYRLIRMKYSLICSYEPDIYPGVKIRYYANTLHQVSKGVCHCSVKCKGKGSGHGNGDCKAVTICIFQSGNVIITGANHFKQIDDTYSFITTIFREHEKDIIYNEPKIVYDQHGKLQIIH